MPSSQINYTNYANGAIDFFINQVYSNSSWINSSKYTYYYNILDNAEFDSQNLLAYPNPASDQITIRMKLEKRDSDYAIVDVLGKSITKGTIQFPESAIEVSYLENGVYFIVMKDSKPLKFIKK